MLSLAVLRWGNENVWILIKVSLKFVPRGAINNIPALVQMMAWRLPGDKPLSEPMLVRLHINASLGLSELVNLDNKVSEKCDTFSLSCSHPYLTQTWWGSLSHDGWLVRGVSGVYMLSPAVVWWGQTLSCDMDKSHELMPYYSYVITHASTSAASFTNMV